MDFFHVSIAALDDSLPFFGLFSPTTLSPTLGVCIHAGNDGPATVEMASMRRT
jgi:hypothetical protein